MLDKIGQHFVLLLVHKLSQIKLPQRYFGENWAAFPLMSKPKCGEPNYAKRVFGQNWGAFCPVFLSTTCHKSNCPEVFWEKLGSIFPDVEAKVQRAKYPKGFWTKLGSILSCFNSTKCHESNCPRVFLRKLGSIFLRLKPKCGEPNYPKRFLDKIGQHFVLSLSTKCDKSNCPRDFLENIGQHFPSCWSKLSQKVLGQIGQHFVLLLIQKMWQIKLPQRYFGDFLSCWSKLSQKVLGQNWTASCPVFFFSQTATHRITPKMFFRNWAAFSLMKPKCGEPNYPKRFLEKIGQHFVLFLIHKMSHSSPKILPQKFFSYNSSPKILSQKFFH